MRIKEEWSCIINYQQLQYSPEYNPEHTPKKEGCKMSSIRFAIPLLALGMLAGCAPARNAEEVLLENGFTRRANLDVYCGPSEGCQAYATAGEDIRVLTSVNGTISISVNSGDITAAQSTIIQTIVGELFGKKLASWINDNLDSKEYKQDVVDGYSISKSVTTIGGDTSTVIIIGKK
jgi:hypothetical protein